MLFLIFVYYLVHSASIDAGPSFDDRSSAVYHCTDLTHCRTIWNIVWSCLVTIFSCSWVAVHPNIPCPKTRKANGWIERCIWNPLLSFAEHRLPLFICALLVPEYVLAWAIRQFFRAREIVSHNKGEFNFRFKFLSISNSLLDRRWSMTHGFFIIMGGFHLFEHGSIEKSNNDQVISQEDDIPLHPLAARDLHKDNRFRSFRTTTRADIDFSSFTVPTKAEIKDKGKSDWLAKTLVLLQTSWFVMQCIARAIKHLPVTHLEIVTLAYAAMNFVIYIFWWNKPLNVNRPIRVFRKSKPSQTPSRVRELTPEARKLTWEAIFDGSKTIFNFIAGNQDYYVDLSREDRVPRFWANSTGEENIADFMVVGIGVCFGAIHCIAWLFSFPTHTELLMWRTSSVAITAAPIFVFLGYLLAASLDNIHVAIISILPAGILYIVARMVTLVLAFTSLRDLPPRAYETVHWTTFIPHV